MLSCRECIERLRPDDPRIPTGRYHQSSCDFYCNKPTRYRDLEQQEDPQPREVVHVVHHSEMSKQESDMLQQLSREVKYLRTKLDERDKRQEHNSSPTRQRGMAIE